MSSADIEIGRGRGVKFLSVPKLRRIKKGPADTVAAAPGSPPDTEPPVWGSVSTQFKDIDGNSFSLVSFDEATHAIEAERRANADKLEAERRFAQELEIAKQVQARLFPQELPPVSSLDYAGSCQQARHVGGDYYDFLALGRDRLGLVIGDIAGKGIAAALLMANLQANLRSQCAMAIDEPERLMRSINRLFFENTPESAYATFFYSEYDDQGRPSPLRQLRTSRRAASFAATTASSASSPPAPFSASSTIGIVPFGETDLFAGDTLALYTDGVTEACDGDYQEYGEQRLVDCLSRHRGLPSHQLVASRHRRSARLLSARATGRHHPGRRQVQGTRRAKSARPAVRLERLTFVAVPFCPARTDPLVLTDPV